MGANTHSEDDGGCREHEVQIEGVWKDMKLVEPGDGTTVPREFANPTDEIPFASTSPLDEGQTMTLSSLTLYPLIYTFTVEDAVSAFGFGKFQWKLCILTGLFWMAEGMEMMILNILSYQLKCEWRLPSWEVALLTSVVFIGMTIGSWFWGNISDKYGRKTGLKLSVLWTVFYGFLSTFAPVYAWILFLRTLVGFGLGGAAQSMTLYIEFLPKKSRAMCLLMLQTFGGVGMMFEVLMAILVMPTLGWRWLLGLSTIPLFICAILYFWIPESARYDVLTGNQPKALATLKRIAVENGVPMPLGKLIAAKQEERGRIQDLFSPHLHRTTVLLWFIWFSYTFCYYGLILLSTKLFQDGGACGVSKGRQMDPKCSLECKYLTSDDYKEMLWTTLAELPALLVMLCLVDRLGRRKTMALCFTVFFLCMVPLYACMGRTSLTALIFIAWSFISGGFQTAYVYTPEVYPTANRALGLGTSSGMGRVGSLITPFVAQVMLESSLYLTLSVYCCCSLLAAIASCMLPIETTGRGLQESGHRERGQEMFGRNAYNTGGIPRSSSGSQD